MLDVVAEVSRIAASGDELVGGLAGLVELEPLEGGAGGALRVVLDQDLDLLILDALAALRGFRAFDGDLLGLGLLDGGSSGLSGGGLDGSGSSHCRLLAKEGEVLPSSTRHDDTVVCELEHGSRERFGRMFRPLPDESFVELSIGKFPQVHALFLVIDERREGFPSFDLHAGLAVSVTHH